MKSVLISIQPKWCELIASDKNTCKIRRKLRLCLWAAKDKAEDMLK